MFGVIPITLIKELEEARPADIPLNHQRKDWKSKEQAAEDFLFYIETLSAEQTTKLGLYADSFVQYVEKTFLADRTLKVVRIGLRALRFVLLYSEQLSSKTNLKRLTTNLIEMLND